MARSGDLRTVSPGEKSPPLCHHLVQPGAARDSAAGCDSGTRQLVHLVAGRATRALFARSVPSVPSLCTFAHLLLSLISLIPLSCRVPRIKSRAGIPAGDSKGKAKSKTQHRRRRGRCKTVPRLLLDLISFHMCSQTSVTSLSLAPFTLFQNCERYINRADARCSHVELIITCGTGKGAGR